jgi:Zn-finger nucleic acid-binding protein
MKCPECKKTTIVVERNKIELDYCSSCRGVWFDAGELNLYLDSINQAGLKQFVDNILQGTESHTAERSLKCPICRRKMHKFNIGQEHKIIIDACICGHGLWFDGGELGQFVCQGGDDVTSEVNTQDKVVLFLEDTFRFKHN